MMSARLPGVSEPVTSPIPSERAPSMVPSDSASRWVIANSAPASAFTIPCVTFMIENMSALPVSTVESTDSPTPMPAARNSGARGREGGHLVAGRAVGVHHLQVGPEQSAGGQRGDLALRGPGAAGVHGDR